MILLGFIRISAGLLDDLGQHPLQSRSFQANRGGFYRKCLRAKGFYLEAVTLQFLGNASENHHLGWF